MKNVSLKVFSQNGEDGIKEIAECEVIDLSDSLTTKKKLINYLNLSKFFFVI